MLRHLRLRVLPHALWLVTGVLLTVLEAQTGDLGGLSRLGLLHVVLLSGGVFAVWGSWREREVPEAIGCALMSGTLATYGCLWGYAAMQVPWPDCLGAYAISAIFFASSASLGLWAVQLRAIVRDELAERRARGDR